MQIDDDTAERMERVKGSVRAKKVRPKNRLQHARIYELGLSAAEIILNRGGNPVVQGFVMKGR
jgi:hypothetical protein